MEQIKIKTVDVPENIVRDLLNFYDKTDLDIESSYEDYKKEAEMFLKNCEGDKVEELSESEIRLNENVILDYSDSFDAVETFEHNVGFFNFYTAVKNYLDNLEPPYLLFKGSNRQKSPPLKAYDFVGHNKELKAKNNGYSYLYR